MLSLGACACSSSEATSDEQELPDAVDGAMAGAAASGGAATSGGAGGSDLSTEAGGAVGVGEVGGASGGPSTDALSGGSGGSSEVVEGPNPTYIKAQNTEGGDYFGVSLALSSDGQTLVVGANGEASAVPGMPDDNSASFAGAVYVFSREEEAWRPSQYIKASNADDNDGFGSAIALSADGSTLAVGAPGESSAAVGVNGDESDNSAEQSGAVYVFTKDGEEWVQQAYIKASNTDEDDGFGLSLALSADGNVLAIAAEAEDGAATGVNGDETEKSASEAGAVYMFLRNGSEWEQDAYIKASNAELRDHFGGSVSLSADGATLAVGAYWEDSSADGVDGDQGDNSSSGTGAAYVFVHDGTTWFQQAYLKPAPGNEMGRDAFGGSVSLSADGNTLAVGAAGDASSGTGIDNGQGDNSTPYAGAAYLFERSADTWQQAAYVKASNSGAEDEFGLHLQLSSDGRRLAVGAALEASSGTGINGDQSANAATYAGAVYLYGNDGGGWSQEAFVKASNTGPGDQFGWALAFSGDAEMLAIGAVQEGSSAAEVDGDQEDNGALGAGAAYVYRELSELVAAPDASGTE